MDSRLSIPYWKISYPVFNILLDVLMGYSQDRSLNIWRGVSDVIRSLDMESDILEIRIPELALLPDYFITMIVIAEALVDWIIL